jgi:hypothetical protein
MCEHSYSSDERCPARSALEKSVWKLRGFEVAYCLSLPVEEKCELQFSVDILLIVIGCNLIKLVCMLMTLWTMNSPALVTLGDSINSFLRCPDDSTKEMCLTSMKTMEKGEWKRRRKAENWKSQRLFWFSAVSLTRGISTNIL